MNLPEAIRELRRELGVSQEALARKMNLTVRTIARYEAGHAPKGDRLTDFIGLAQEAGRADLVEAFRAALVAQFDWVLNPRSLEESFFCMTILELLRNPQFENLQKPLRELIRPVMTYMLEHPDRFNVGLLDVRIVDPK